MFGKTKDVRKILSEVYEKDKGARYLQFIVGMLIAAISFNLFILPNNIVYGVGGVGVILKKLFNVDPSITMLIGDIILLILSLIVLGSNETKSSIIGSIIYPIFVGITSWIPEYITIENTEPFVLILFGAVISGFGYGLIFKSGFTTGGTDILNQIVSKYGKMSLGNAMLFTDGLIIVAGLMVFGFSMVLYSIINMYIIGLMTDKVMIGISQTKSFFIITSKHKEVKEFILGELGHGVTVLEGTGAFSGHNKNVLMCVIPTREYFVAKEGIHEIDNNAFFVVSDAYEVYGNK